MTEFATEVRHYCRNPKCRSKLKAPIANTREAFCTRGCRERFYRLRCYVCEEKKPGRLDAHTCGRRKCKNAIRSLKRPEDTSRVEIGLGNPIKSGLPEADKYGRAWKVVAGEISPNAFHCASLPDGPNCQWKGGELERVEAKNRAALKAAGESRDRGQWLLHRSRLARGRVARWREGLRHQLWRAGKTSTGPTAAFDGRSIDP